MKTLKRAVYIFVAAMVLMCCGRMNVMAQGTEDDDPGKGRLSGNASQEFYSESSQTMGNARLASVTTSANPYTGISYTHSSAFDACDILNGIDVSKFQTTIDWNKVKAAGIDYAFIRAANRGYGSTGNIVTDSSFEEHISGALEAGLPVGAYIFSQAITVAEAEEEADYIINLLSDYTITMPVVFDFEFASDGTSTVGRLYNANLTKAQATAICNAFCAKVKAAGYTPMVYANKDMLNNHLNASSISNNYKIWLANYPESTTSSTVFSTDYTGSYEFWQYTQEGTVDGVSGNVDCNFWYSGDIVTTPEPSVEPSTEPVVETPTITGKKITGLKKSASATTSITLAWTKLADATGYQIYRATSLTGTYSKVKTITNGSTVTLKQTGLLAGKEYFYKVRAYQTVNSKNYYGTFSAILTSYTKSSYTSSAITKSALKMRKTASTSATAVKTLAKGVTTSVISYTYAANGVKWYHVTYTVSSKTYTGYVCGTYVTIYKYGKTTAAVNMRKNAGTSYAIIIKAAKNTKVTILSSKKAANGVTWYRCKFTKNKKTYTGYISSYYVKLV